MTEIKIQGMLGYLCRREFEPWFINSFQIYKYEKCIQLMLVGL